MSFLDTIKGYFDNKSEERLEMEGVQRQIDFERRQVFLQEYKKNALEAAKIRAKQEAYDKSGLGRLRALNRGSRLEDGGPPPGSFFEKMAEYTQKNLKKRDENLARTKMLREQAATQQVEDQAKRESDRANRSITRPKMVGFNNSQWKQ